MLLKKLADLCNGKILVSNINHTVTLRFPVKCSCEDQSNHSPLCFTNHTEIEKIDRLLVKAPCKRNSHKPTIADLKIEMSILIKNNRFLRKSFLQRLFGEEFLEIKASEILQDGEHPLISKVTKIILENLDNEKLTIGSIAKELGISRTSLYNKWTQLTGEALNKFILKIRMEKAHEMLESGKYRVNEIPENIGMKDMDHFRDNYKKHFGKTPAHTIKNV